MARSPARESTRPWLFVATAFAAATVAAIWLWKDDGALHPTPEPLTVAEPVAKPDPRPLARDEPARVQPEAPTDSLAESLLRVVVLDGRGAAVKGHLVLFRDDQVFAESGTDLSGGARFFDATLPASVAILAQDREPAIHQLTRASGTEIIRVAENAVVAGAVLVDGKFPHTSLTLRLRSSAARTDRTRLPPAIERANRTLNPDAPALRTATSLQDGRFRFAGLDDAWRGTLEVPEEYRIAGAGGREIALARPDPDLVVSLVQRPTLVGRVVNVGQHEPVREAAVTVTGMRPEGETVVVGSATTADDGRFCIPLTGTEGLSSGLVTIATQSGLASHEYVVTGGDLDQGRDLGDLEVEAARRVQFLIHGRGARILLHSGGVPRLLARAQDYVAAVDLPHSLVRVRIAASGARPHDMDVPPGKDRLMVDLSRTTRLVVKTVLSDGATETAAAISLEADHPILEDFMEVESDGESRRKDREVTQWGSENGGRRVTLGNAPLSMTGIRSGIPITVTARDHATDSTVSANVVLRENEWKELLLTLPAFPRQVEGRVLDAEGNPVKTADVALESPTRALGVTSTANDGSFSFGRVTAEDATVVVDMPGFARFEQRISIPREGVTLAIRLERAQAPLAITVRDRRNQPLQGASVTFPDQDGSRELTTDARGQATIDSPPAGEMLIRARIGWVEAQATRRDGDRDVAITLPSHGSVRIETPREIPTPRPRVRLVSLDPASTVLPETGLSDAVTTLSGVPAGRYRLEIVGPDSGPDGKPVVRSGPEVHVVDGETATATVEVPR